MEGKEKEKGREGRKEGEGGKGGGGRKRGGGGNLAKASAKGAAIPAPRGQRAKPAFSFLLFTSLKKETPHGKDFPQRRAFQGKH